MLFEKIHLEADEKVLKVVRKHWFILLTRILNVLLAAVAPALLWLFISNQNNPIANITINPDAFLLHFVYLYSIWIIFCWLAVVYIWTDHYLDVWTITDRRIIAMEQVRLWNRRTGSFRLERLQDVNIEINGIVATLLHYGTIELQTASGSEDEFRTSHIPDPRHLRALILQAADKRLEKETIPEPGL